MKHLIGTVVSTKMNGTAIVEVTRKWEHPLYKKVVKRTSRFACSIGKAQVKPQQVIEMIECRPISKTVHFKLVDSTPVEKETKKSKSKKN